MDKEDEEAEQQQGERGLVVSVDEPVCGRNQVEFSPHALDRMKQRQITEKQVLDTIRNPERMGLKTQKNRERYRTFLGTKRALDVVVEMIDERPVVVTTFVTSLKVRERPNEE